MLAARSEAANFAKRNWSICTSYLTASVASKASIFDWERFVLLIMRMPWKKLANFEFLC